MEITDVITTILIPAVAGVAGWFAKKKKDAFESRRASNDFISEMQTSINMLIGKNNELIQDVVSLRQENAEQRRQISDLVQEVAGLRKENAELRKQIEDLSHKLENIKTITRRAKQDEN
jgi:uncharacterized protein YlxW (UPF0749 family)